MAAQVEDLPGPEVWLQAVADRRQQHARAVAAALCEERATAGNIPPALIALCRDNGVSERFIGAPFNPLDSLVWGGLYELKELADQALADAAESAGPVEVLFAVVRDRVRPEPAPQGLIPWPWQVWRVGRGVCDRQAWLLCELAYQVGIDGQIVYLRNPDELVSPHTICELRDANRVWLADPLSGKLLPGVSLGGLAADSGLRASLWPDRPDWQAAVAKAHYFLPAYPQDYCPRNQALASLLAERVPDAPRFGEPPARRQARYVARMSETDRAFDRAMWFYPFRLLKAQMRALRAQ